MDQSLIWFLVIGLIAGWLAGQVMRGGSFGLIGNLIVGVVGALIGGWLFGTAYGFVGSLVVAFVGAVILLFLLSLVSGRRRR